MSTKAAPTVSTIERVLEDLDEWYGRVKKIREKLGRLKRGSPAYPDLLNDLWAEVD